MKIKKKAISGNNHKRSSNETIDRHRFSIRTDAAKSTALVNTNSSINLYRMYPAKKTDAKHLIYVVKTIASVQASSIELQRAINVKRRTVRYVYRKFKHFRR